MSERNSGFNLITGIFDMAVSGAVQFVDDTVQNIRYRQLVTDVKHLEAVTGCELFVSDALSFLNDNLTSKLAPLHPTGEQLKVFQFLMRHTRLGNLKLQKTQGLLDPLNKPCVLKLHSYHDRRISFGVGLGSAYYVNAPIRHLGVFAFGENDQPSIIDFMTFPNKPNNQNEVLESLGAHEKDRGFTQTVSFFNKNERIVINTEGRAGGRNISTTTQYYLIGAFDGTNSKEAYWVYGHNSEVHTKTTFSEPVKQPKTITQNL